MLARKTAEAICKLLFIEHITADAGSATLDRLIERLVTGKHLPKRVVTHLRTIQVHGNFGSHDQDDDDFIDQDYVQPCIHSLDYVCRWFFDNLPPIIFDGPIIVREFAAELGMKPFQLIRALMELKIFANPDNYIPKEDAETIAAAHGRRLQFVK